MAASSSASACEQRPRAPGRFGQLSVRAFLSVEHGRLSHLRPAPHRAVAAPKPVVRLRRLRPCALAVAWHFACQYAGRQHVADDSTSMIRAERAAHRTRSPQCVVMQGARGSASQGWRACVRACVHTVHVLEERHRLGKLRRRRQVAVRRRVRLALRQRHVGGRGLAHLRAHNALCGSLSRGGWQNCWHALADCDHRDSMTRLGPLTCCCSCRAPACAAYVASARPQRASASAQRSALNCCCACSYSCSAST
jgi:hypothetical protein